ncbi:MAG: lipocalin family protein [Acidobacteriota bacterium]
MKKRTALALTVATVSLLFLGFARLPDGAQPVQGFELEQFYGRWYEIARSDNRWERGLDNVTATYSPLPNGDIEIRNRGRKTASGEWTESTGRAEFVGPNDIGRLKVSFFGPFYIGYNVLAHDTDENSYMLVCGSNHKYLWILAREPVLEPGIVDELLVIAEQQGFDVDDLIFVDHDLAEPTRRDNTRLASN